MALRQFCQEDNLKWVSLLMWAGANPRSRGPALDDVEHIDDPDWHTTALHEACASGNVEDPEAAQAQLERTISRACSSARRSLRIETSLRICSISARIRTTGLTAVRVRSRRASGTWGGRTSTAFVTAPAPTTRRPGTRCRRGERRSSCFSSTARCGSRNPPR